MSRKAKREIAKARQRNASGRVADAWTMQRMAVELGEKDAEIERLRKELAYWEHIGRDKLDVELMRGLANEQTQRS